MALSAAPARVVTNPLIPLAATSALVPFTGCLITKVALGAFEYPTSVAILPSILASRPEVRSPQGARRNACLQA